MPPDLTDLPTITVHPSDPPTTGDDRPLASPPDDRKKLTYTDMVKRWRALGYSEAGAKGIADNMMRESHGDSTASGDDGTSRGLFQHHAERKSALESFAKERGTSPDDPDTQIAFADQELQTKFPKLRDNLMKTEDRSQAEDQFRRIFERPASIMWANRPDGGPVLGNGRFRFSDYALREHAGRKNADLVYMTPQDYLDLSPDMEAQPFTSKSGKSLRASFDKGDEIESVPSLDMRVKGQTGTITAQDGRHRALLAQEEGIDAIPVVINRRGQGTPTEIEGMGGSVIPHDFQAADKVEAKKSERGILGRALDMVAPPAEAAEANPYAKWATSTGREDNPYAEWTTPATPPSGDARPVLERVGEGMRDPIEAGAQALSHALPDAIVQPLNRANNWLADKTGAVGRLPEGGMDQEVRDRESAIQKSRGGEAGMDWWRLGGNAAATMPLAALAGAAAPATALARIGGAALAGAAGGALQPVTEGEFWPEKGMQAGLGAVAGVATGAAGNAVAKMVAPKLRSAVQTLMHEGVGLTPGQMAGGAARAMEDKLMSVPLTGDAIAAARRRSYEDFNRAAWNRALAPIGEKMPEGVKMGREASDYVGDRLGAVYRSVLPHLRLTSVQNDTAFVRDLTGVVADAKATLPEAQFRQFENIVRAQVLGKLGAAGTSIDGEVINGIDSMLGAEARGYKGDPMHDNRKLGQAIEELQVAFRNLLERQNPAEAPILKTAREGWANYVRVAKAGAATGTGTNEGIFSPAQLNAAVRAEDNTTRKLGYSKGSALLQDLSDAGVAVLPSKYPDSGTAGRAMFGALTGVGTGGAGYFMHSPEIPLATLGMLTGGAIPYTARANAFTNMVMRRLSLPPGPARNALAQFLQRGGGAVAPAAGAAMPMSPHVAQ